MNSHLTITEIQILKAKTERKIKGLIENELTEFTEKTNISNFTVLVNNESVELGDGTKVAVALTVKINASI